ncbi:MAG TPA: efflux RND transporter periplasmic adaptor subunit [Gemmatimonadaceae bacterium]
MTDTTPGSRSPFESGEPTPRRRILRSAVSAAVVLMAVVVAVLMTRDTPEATATAEHNHGASGAATMATPVSLDAEQARRIGVTFAEATVGSMSASIRSLGEVVWDETRTTAIAPKVDGWVERLHVDFTGQDVRQGQPLLDIYSPMLVTAQEELLLAARLAREVANGTEEARRSADDMLASARRRLQYWDIPAADIERVERSGQVSRTLTLRATSRGVVVEKRVVAGQRIMPGETLYRLADLSRVWVDGQVFEHDLALVRTGQRVSVEIQAYPGERWSGAVTYVYPLVDPATRTAKVRVELANAGLRLKPGMFATVHLTSTGRDRVLSVPRSAVLATGERSIVFLRTPTGVLEPREVVTGAANDDRIEIRSGLVAGDTVVASATFLVDAESNLQSALGGMAGMPGMVAPGSKPVPGKAATIDTSRKAPPPDDHSKHQHDAAGQSVAPTGRQKNAVRQGG